MKTAHSYARFSHENTRNPNQTSIKRQAADFDAYCQEKGFQAGQRLKDEGVSAFKGKNAAVKNLAKFLASVKSKQVKRGDILVIEQFDRLTRMPLDDAKQLTEGILRAGVSIHTLQDRQEYVPEDLNKLEKCLQIAFRLSTGHEYSKALSKRLSAAWQIKREKLANGETKKFTARVPGWLTWNGSKFVFNDNAKIVRQMIGMAMEGKGRPTIAKELNQAGVKWWGRSGKFDPCSIKLVLRNRALLGEFTPEGGQTTKDYFPAMLTIQQWGKLQGILDARSFIKGKPCVKTTNLFQGMMKDEQSGTTICIARRPPNHIYLVPFDSLRGITKQFVSFPYRIFEDYFFEFVKTVDAASLFDTADDGDRLGMLEADLADTRQRLEKLYKALDADGDIALIARKAKELETFQERLIAEIEQHKANVSEAPGRCFRALQTLTAKERENNREGIQTLIRQAVESITMRIEGSGKYNRFAYVAIELKSKKTVSLNMFVNLMQKKHMAFGTCDDGAKRLCLCEGGAMLNCIGIKNVKGQPTLIFEDMATK